MSARRWPVAAVLMLLACTGPDPGDDTAPTEPGPTDGGGTDGGGTDGGGADGGGADGGSDGGTGGPVNLLANGGFEAGESWWRPAGYVNHAWSRTGDPVHASTDSFVALEGEHAQKIWGFYSGSVPNESEHGLSLADLSPGDLHTVTAQAFTHPDDAVSGGSSAVLFLRFLDAEGETLDEVVSSPVDDDFSRGTWQELRVEATAPEGTVAGALGLRFHLADWSATGSVYLDEVAWTSTGSGRVAGERLLTWHDEFDGDALDEASWTRLELDPYTFNNELQRYTASTDNADVRDGQLVITARRESDGEISSARLVTAGRADWLTGRIEGMLQVPAGVGTWPALWMLPSGHAYGGWPDSGEIDIMEHVGCDPGTVHGTVHTGAYNHLLGTQQSGSTWRDATDALHLYAVDWTEEELRFTVDGEEILRFANDGAGNPETWPFDQTFHLVLNLAFGGDWGGYCGVDTAALPQEYRVDWVRVYQ